MAFELTVTFRGLMALASNEKGDHFELLVPNTLCGTTTGFPPFERPKALDGADLIRHEPRLLLPGLPLLLHHHRIRFPQLSGTVKLPGSRLGLPQMCAVVKRDLCRVDLQELKKAKRLAAAMTFKSGKLIPVVNEGFEVTFPKKKEKGEGATNLNPQPLVSALQWKVGVEETNLVVQVLDIKSEKELLLTSVEPVKGKVNVAFVNPCLDPFMVCPPGEDDYDFKWYYELLTKTSREEITKDFQGGSGGDVNELRVPRVTKKSASLLARGPTTINCLIAEMSGALQ